MALPKIEILTTGGTIAGKGESEAALLTTREKFLETNLSAQSLGSAGLLILQCGKSPPSLLRT